MSLKILSCNFLMKGIKKAKGLAENFKQNVEIKLVWQVISSGIQGAPQTK